MNQQPEPRPAPHLGLGFRLAHLPTLADEATRRLLPWAKERALASRNASNGSNAKKACNPTPEE